MSDLKFESPVSFISTLGDKSKMSADERLALLEVIQMYLEGANLNTAADLEAFGEVVKEECLKEARLIDYNPVHIDKSSILSISIPSLLKQFKGKEGK